MLLAGTGQSATTKATGSHGGAFWAHYVQRRCACTCVGVSVSVCNLCACVTPFLYSLPQAVVRSVADSSLGLLGPDFNRAMENDPWGTTRLVIKGMRILPPPTHWHIGRDDLSLLYEHVAREMPSVAFADVSSVDDTLQQGLWEVILFALIPFLRTCAYMQHRSVRSSPKKIFAAACCTDV